MPTTLKATEKRRQRIKQKSPKPRYNGGKSAFAILMRYKGISNADLSRYMAVNHRTIVKWYNNPLALTLRQLTQISGLLDCPVELLVRMLSINNTHPSNAEKVEKTIQEAKIRFNIP